MSNNGQIPPGMLGLGWAIAQGQRDQTYHGYVQTFLAQGHDLATAQQMANTAMGYRTLAPAERAWRKFRRVAWAAVAFYVIAVAMLVTAHFPSALLWFGVGGGFHAGAQYLQKRAGSLQRSEGHA